MLLNLQGLGPFPSVVFVFGVVFLLLLFLFGWGFFCLFLLFRATSIAYGSSQARG